MRYAIVLLTLLAACKPEVHAEVHFARGATAVATVDVADPAGKVGAEDVTVYEPYELRDISFRGIRDCALAAAAAAARQCRRVWITRKRLAVRTRLQNLLGPRCCLVGPAANG